MCQSLTILYLSFIQYFPLLLAYQTYNICVHLGFSHHLYILWTHDILTIVLKVLNVRFLLTSTG